MPIVIPVMGTPEPEPDDFHKMQQSIDINTWVGRHTTMELGGGGNADGDMDADPIDSLHTGYHGIAGPQSALEKGNKR